MKKLVTILVLCLTCTFYAVGFSACDFGKCNGDDTSKDNGVETNGNTYTQPTNNKYFTFTLLDNDTYEISAKYARVFPTEIVLPENHDGKSVTSIGDSAFNGYENITSVIIPDSVTIIGEYAFNNCSDLTTITIGNNVTSIGERAFSSCRSLTSITIPDSVTNIGDGAFFWCDALTNVSIGSGITYIGDDAFSGCDALTNVTIGNGITYIGKGVFDDCLSLQCNVYDNGEYLGNDDNPYIVFLAACMNETSYIIHNDTKFIYDCAFLECWRLESVTIPDSVTSIGIYAFEDCYSLTSVTFKNTSGWKVVSYNSDMSDAINISSSDLENATTAAQYLTDTYCYYFWQRG